MKDARPALRYAKAILSLAKENKIASEINTDMVLIIETIATSDELQLLLNSPVTKATEKKKVLNAIFGNKINAITTGLFNLLEDNKVVSSSLAAVVF